MLLQGANIPTRRAATLLATNPGGYEWHERTTIKASRETHDESIKTHGHIACVCRAAARPNLACCAQ